MKYRLEFAVLKEGYFIQAPYPPFNLRAIRGSYTIEPGELLRLKYHLVLHRGNPEEIKVRYLEWIAEPVVRLGAVQKGPDASPEWKGRWVGAHQLRLVSLRKS
jgi:hypothetical protein